MLTWPFLKNEQKSEELFPKEGICFLNKNDEEQGELDKYIEKLKEFADSVPEQKDELKSKVIEPLEAGRNGENSIEYYLKHYTFRFPIYCIRDIYLEIDGLTAQIDFILITPKYIYSLECKNWKENVVLNSEGNFYRNGNIIKNPITQNNNHLTVIKRIIEKALGRNLDSHYKSLIVNSNENTEWKCFSMKSSDAAQIVRADRLGERIMKNEDAPDIKIFKQSEMKEIVGLVLAEQAEKRYYEKKFDKIKQKYSKDQEQKSTDGTDKDSAVEELTMLLLYLSSVDNSLAHKGDVMWAWKNYSYDILNKLDREDYINQTVRAEKKVYITEKGEERAKKIMEKYGITE